MNTKISITLKSLIVLFVILTLLPAMMAFEGSDPRPEPAAPDEQMPVPEVEFSSAALLGTTALTRGMSLGPV